MFQFLRRVSGSFLPRPDRPWRDDATSHAPVIGRKRRHSVTEDIDRSASTTKRARNDAVPDAGCDSASEEERDASPPLEGQDVKEVTKGVEEVDLEDKEVLSSRPPEGVPLPDSPSGSSELESESPELAYPDVLEEPRDEEHAVDDDSVPLTDDAKEEEEEDSDRTRAESVTVDVEAESTDASAWAQEAEVDATVELDLRDTLEVKA